MPETGVNALSKTNSGQPSLANTYSSANQVLPGNLIVTGNLQVDGNATLESAATVDGLLTANNGLSTTGISINSGPTFTYAIGTFAPTMVFLGGGTPTITYHRQNGTYTQIGNMIVAAFDVLFDYGSGGGGTTAWGIQGFPKYVCGSITNTQAVCTMSSNSNGGLGGASWNVTNLFGFLCPAGGQITLSGALGAPIGTFTMDGHTLVPGQYNISVIFTPIIDLTTVTVTQSVQAEYTFSSGSTGVQYQGVITYTLS